MAMIVGKLSPEAELGDLLGKGLSGGLKNLIDSKLGQLQKQAGLSSMMSPEQAQALSHMPEGLLKTLLPQMMKQQAKQQEYQQGLSHFTGKQVQPLDTQPGYGDQAIVDRMASQQQAGQPVETMQPMQTQPGYGYQDIVNRIAAEQQQGQQAQPVQVKPAAQQADIPGQVQPEVQKPTKAQIISNEDALALNAGKEAFMLTRDKKAALHAQQAAKQRLQNERISNQRQTDRLDIIKEGRATSSIKDSRKRVAEIDESIQVRSDTIDNYNNIKELIKTGKVDTSLIFQAKSLAGIDTSGSSPETQLAVKLLAAEPVRALKGLPGQAARLSKVFDQLVTMNGTLKNTEAGLDLIAESKILEAQSANAVDKEEILLREKYREIGEEAPFTIRQMAANSPKVKVELDKIHTFVTKRISDSVIEREPEAKLSKFKEGQSILINGSDEVYKKIKTDAGYFWKPLYGLEKTKAITNGNT